MQEQSWQDYLTGKNVGVVTNHTGLNRQFERNIDLLAALEGVQLTAIFSPEHGYWGNARDRARIGDDHDRKTGLPIYSLYGEVEKPGPEMLADMDLLIYDIQDIGLRYYTYISTLFYSAEACAENGVELLVLDRLNPLGRRVEGGLPETDFRCFEDLYPLPHQHGMTVGELANWARTEYYPGLELEVVKLRGWSGELFPWKTANWIPPSPNIPTFETCLIYPVTCLFEGTNISEGRGTNRPFEYIGAPWIDPFALVERLKEKKLRGLAFRPVKFIPSFSKYQGEECGGLQLLLSPELREERGEAESSRGRTGVKSGSDNLQLGLTILQAVLELSPGELNWLRHPGDERYFFDLLMGTARVRKQLLAGMKPAGITAGWAGERLDFLRQREKYLFY